MKIYVLTTIVVLLFEVHQCVGQQSQGKSRVTQLNENNWELMLKNEWMVEFYAPWCPACKSLSPIWDEFSSWSEDLGIKTGTVDVTTSPALSGRFFVSALPTIFHVYNGEIRQYRGARDLNSFMTFIEEKKWKNVDPVSHWTRPDSIQMSVVSYFFKLSYNLKEVNDVLLKEYGLPTWVSYAIFAVITILIGAILGLCLVCVTDFICPQKQHSRRSFIEVQEKERIEKGSAEELITGDDIEDEEEDVDEDDEEIEAEEAEEAEDDNHSTSDGEKYSGSESDEAESKKQSNEKETSPKKDSGEDKTKTTPTSSPEVRKRKPRKAD